MNTYVAIYRGKRTEVEADTSYAAQLKAAAELKARKSYDVVVMLAAKDGVPVVHAGGEI